MKAGGGTVPTISLRPVTDADAPLLLRIYASTRAEELAVVPWTEAERRAFIEMQFHAQHSAYQQYTDATFDVILVNGTEAGRLYVARWPDEIRIVDIALLPEFRGQGAGAILIGRLINEARQQQKPLRIHVERFNRALRLYERLGFRVIADKGVYLFLERGHE